MSMELNMKSARSIFVCVFLISAVGIAQESETVARKDFRYQRFSSPEEVVYEKLGRTALDEIRQDIEEYFNIEQYHEFDTIKDFIIVPLTSSYRWYFIEGINNYVTYTDVESLDDMPSSDGLIRLLYGEGTEESPYFISPSAVDAVPILGGVRLFVADRGTDQIVIYDHIDFDEPEYVMTIKDNIHEWNFPHNIRGISKPIDIACFNDAYGGWQYPFIIVLTYDGSAIVVYEYDADNEEMPFVFRSSFGLPTEMYIYDGHPWFFKKASSIYSQDGKIYVCDTGHNRIAEFRLNYQGQLSLSNVYQYDSDVTLSSVTGDRNGGIYIIDDTHDQVIKFHAYGGESSIAGPLVEVERFGANEGESVQLENPMAMNVTESNVFISERITAENGFLRGKLGGRIKDVAVSYYQEFTHFIKVNGIVTGECSNIEVHSIPDGGSISDDRITFVGDLSAGPLRVPNTDYNIVVTESREYGTYNIWLTWESGTCEEGCRYPLSDYLIIDCGVVEDNGETPTPYNCPGENPVLRVCWDPIPNITKYKVRWRVDGDPPQDWQGRQYTTCSFTVPDAQPCVLYEVQVAKIINGEVGQWGSMIASRDILDAPSDVIVYNRGSSFIGLNASPLDAANGFRVYYGTNPSSLNGYKDFPNYESMQLSFPEDLTYHNVEWYFEIAGCVYDSQGGIIQEGPRSAILSAPLAPTTSGVISWPERWFSAYDPDVIVTDALIIDEPGCLTIEGGTTLITNPDAVIYVNSELTTLGTSNSNVNIYSQTQAEQSATIEASGSATVDLKWTNIEGGGSGVFVRYGDLFAEDCNFTWNNHGLILIGADASVIRSTFENAEGHGAVVIRSDPWFDNCIFRSNQRTGIMIWNTNHAHLFENTFEQNGSGDVLWNTGLRVLNGFVSMHCNDLRNNNGPGLALLQGFIDMVNFESPSMPGGRNSIFDNCTNPMFINMGEIYYAGTAIPHIDHGLNTIHSSNSQYLIHTPNPYEVPPDPPVDPVYLMEAYARSNYWGTLNINLIHQRLPYWYVVDPILENPVGCDEPGHTVPEPESASFALLQQGLMLETSASYDAAMARYDSILKYYPESKEVPTAIDRMKFCKTMQSESWMDIRAYFIAIADTTKTPNMEMAALNTAAWCLVEMGLYDDARDEFQHLIDQSVKDYDVMYNSMGKLMSELDEDDWLSLSSESHPTGKQSRDKKKTTKNRYWKKNTTLATKCNSDVDSRRAYRIKLNQVLSRVDSLLGNPAGDKTDLLLPTKYALYQNYPNPFNPTTEIRFDLPEAVRVELKVFNILGQEVATLIDEMKPAGFHRIQWNSQTTAGTSVASGVYIYQIKAGQFVNAKKMVLIR